MYNLRNTWLSVILIAAATLFFAGCEEDGQGIGAEVLPPEDIINFTFTDTISIEIETIVQDSINTYRATDLLFGNYADPEFGRIKATIYTEFIARSGLDFGEADDLILDSVVLALGIRDSYGRLDLENNMEVFELDEDIPEPDLANSDVPLIIKGDNLAQGVRFTYDSAGRAQLVRVQLDRAFGERLLKAGVENLGDALAFREFFKGFAISTEDVQFLNREPGAIFSIDVLDGTPQLQMYYKKRESGQFTVQTPEPFLVTGSTPRYTGIARTATEGKLIQQAIDREDLKDQLELIQAGAFVKNFVKFPHVDKMDLVAVSRAELLLSVDTSLLGSTGAFLPPAQIAPILADADGNEELNENGFPVDVEFNLSAVASYDASTGTYSFDLTGYIQRLISGQIENNGILLHPASRAFTMNRAVFGGILHPTLKAKLNLTYTSLPR
ncbi:MAG: DUF4270 family protein [Bacteroidia bacterium]|nr:DUF4270 family protein [Bacteroidia bacterium]